MQICTVISASRMPGKQDSRTLWLNVLKRKGRREIGKIPFLCGQFPVYPFSGFTLYADSKSAFSHIRQVPDKSSLLEKANIHQLRRLPHYLPGMPKKLTFGLPAWCEVA